MKVIFAVMNTTRAVVKRRPKKKFRPVRDFNPWSLRYRCSALLTELTSQLGAGHYVGSQLTREVVNKRLWIYEIHIFELLIKTWIWKRSSRCTNIAEVMGSNPVQAWIFFFSGLLFTTAQVVFITAKIAFIFTSLSAVQIYDFHIFTAV